MKIQRIGIMGGTFNPIHYGHLIIAENARTQFGLDQVIFLPTGYMPHKDYGGQEMTAHRCEMVRLAIEDNDYFSLSTYETDRKEVNYTYKTLEAFTDMYPGAQLYFILGADSLFSFESWRCPDLICQRATILAAVRDSMTESKVDEQIQYLKDKYNTNIYRLDSPNFSVSSKQIRYRVLHNETVRYMLPESVRLYVESNHLYTEK